MNNQGKEIFVLSLNLLVKQDMAKAVDYADTCKDAPAKCNGRY